MAKKNIFCFKINNMIIDKIQPFKIKQNFRNLQTRQISKDYRNSCNEISAILQPSFLVQATEDNQYRSELLESIGISQYGQYRIQSIMGPHETKRVLNELQRNEENFIASAENIKNGKFRANLHIHTTASDGFYSPKELLNDAAEYSNKVMEKTGKHFVIAITDHDSIGSYSDVIKEIYDNPDKYKNLKVILGMESTTYEDVKNRPIQFHMLVYNINPADKKFKTFMHNQENKKEELTKFIINDVNNKYKKQLSKDTDLLSYDEFSNAYPVMKKRILSTHNYLRKYVMTKLLVSDVVPKVDILKDYFDETNPQKEPKVEMLKMKESQYDFAHNNFGYHPLSGISEYYAKVTDNTAEDIENAIYNEAKKSDKLLNFIAKVNDDLLNHKNIDGKNFYVNISEVYDALSNQPQAMLGIAHPLNTVLDKQAADFIDPYENVLYKRKKKDKSKVKENQTPEFIEAFYNRFKEEGKEKAKFSEVFYQSYSVSESKIQSSQEIKEVLNNFSLNNNMFKTGGCDTHRKNIFARYW